LFVITESHSSELRLEAHGVVVVVPVQDNEVPVSGRKRGS
jgi:hypothetical protein